MTPFDIDAAIRIVDPYGHDEGDDLAVRLGISADGDIWPAYWEWQDQGEEAA